LGDLVRTQSADFANVRFEWYRRQNELIQEYATVVGLDGHFEFRHVPSGRYDLWFFRSNSGDSESAQISDSPFDIEVKEPLRDVGKLKVSGWR
jgi:hypothetical protein